MSDPAARVKDPASWEVRGTTAVVTAAVHGARVWACYWVLECTLCVVLPWFQHDRHLYRPLPAGMTALLLFLYVCTGAVLGGAAGALFVAGRASSRRLAAGTSLGLAAVFTTAFFMESGLHPYEGLVLSMNVLLVASLAAATFSEGWQRRFGFLANSPVVSSLLLVGPWVMVEISGSSRIKAVCTVGAWVVILAAALLTAVVAEPRVRMHGAPREARMRRADALLGALVALVLALGLFLDQEPLVHSRGGDHRRTDRHRPNVVLITLDTVRADHLSLYGYARDTSPNLARIAAEGTLYRRAVASGDMTLPTHGSLFTGLYASRHGARYRLGAPGLGTPLKEGIPTLAEILAREGYATAGVVANHGFLQHSFGLDRGFEYYDQRLPVPFLGEVEMRSLRRGFRGFLKRFATPSDCDVMYRQAWEINREAFLLLERFRRDDEAFFLFLNYMDAHQPYFPPPPFDSRFPGKDASFTFERFDELHRRVLEGAHALTDRERLHLLSQYDGGIAYVDAELGELVRKLKDLGLYDETLLVVTSDHGEAFGERGLIEHGVSVYQDQVRVPLVLKPPGPPRPAAVDDLADSVDVMPTVLDILGFEVPAGLDGRSLRSPGGLGQRSVFSEHFPSDWQIQRHPRLQRGYHAIFSGDWKLVASTTGVRELYDLAVDADERNDLILRAPEQAARLQQELDAWIRTLPQDSGRVSDVDSETIERLRSLGYVQ